MSYEPQELNYNMAACNLSFPEGGHCIKVPLNYAIR
jgi:hypothetical protein